MAMKAALITSVALHTMLLGLCMFSLSSSISFDVVKTEPLPISVVPLGDKILIREGDPQAIKIEKLPPRPMQRLLEKLDAGHAGEREIDTKLPFRPKEKQRKIEAALPVSGAFDARLDITPQEKLAAAEAIQKTSDSVEALPKKGPMLAAKPKQVVKKAKLEVEKEKKSHSLARGDSINDILAINQSALLDKTRTQGGGARRGTEATALGNEKDVGDSAFQQTLNNIIGRCVQSQWDLAAISGSTAYDLRVIVHFRLNQNGTLNGDPELNPVGGDSAQRDIIAIQALAALKKCAPFALPVQKYNQWHDVTINMKAFPD
ncbi:MAG: hypothetical protein JSC189_001329 [Candidatus Tokpelaia sp. JSC189]|nr:MAG: hypothetical protein JSC189_001329 [Candidatus Tokpelaia sp. JSC189]